MFNVLLLYAVSVCGYEYVLLLLSRPLTSWVSQGSGRCQRAQQERCSFELVLVARAFYKKPCGKVVNYMHGGSEIYFRERLPAKSLGCETESPRDLHDHHVDIDYSFSLVSI